MSHVGIDPDVLNARLRLPETAEHEGRLREQCKVGERIVVGGVEMLHPLQGAHIKLLAFQQLLENYPVWRKRLTLLQVCFPDKQRPEQSAQQSAENREVVRRIEEAFGPDTIRYFEARRWPRPPETCPRSPRIPDAVVPPPCCGAARRRSLPCAAARV